VRLEPVHHHVDVIGKVGRGGLEDPPKVKIPIGTARYLLRSDLTLFPGSVTAFAGDRVGCEKIRPVSV
jgi:hypothetical protein